MAGPLQPMPCSDMPSKACQALASALLDVQTRYMSTATSKTLVHKLSRNNMQTDICAWSCAPDLVVVHRVLDVVAIQPGDGHIGDVLLRVVPTHLKELRQLLLQNAELLVLNICFRSAA